MIELVIEYKKTWSMFTLASLLDKNEEFRLHLYVREADWKDAPIDWIIDNFPNVKIYQAFWTTNFIPRAICHLREFWKNKGLNKRILVASGNRIFTRNNWKNEIPSAEFFQNKLSHLSHKRVFRNHPKFARFYKLLNISYDTENWKHVDPEFFILNYDQLKDVTYRDLFFGDNRFPNDIDQRVLRTGETYFYHQLLQKEHSWVPLYMNGKNDILIQEDAIEAKDLMDYNVMLRKSWSINIQHKWLHLEYWQTPIGVQLAVPWDLYTRQIDNIPLEYRNARANEILLTKAEKQKQQFGKLLETGFILGKI